MKMNGPTVTTTQMSAKKIATDQAMRLFIFSR